MEYNIVGKIIKPHGLKGEVKIKTDSDFIKERFSKSATLFIKSGENYTELTVNTHRSMKDYELVSFIGFDDVDKVIPLSGQTLYGEKSEDLLEGEGHFYSDLVGKEVYQFGKLAGIVTDIEAYPQAYYLVVKQGDKEKLVPIMNEFIEKIDDEKGIIYIVDMEGLL